MTLMHPQHPRKTGKPWPREIIDPGLIATDSWPQNLPIGRTNQAPRPEGFQRAVTGLADYITGNKWDFDQRGRGAEQGVREGGGILDRIGNFLGGLGVNQDYEDGVMRDSSGGRLYPNPYGEGNVHENLYNDERWHQDQMRRLRPQQGGDLDMVIPNKIKWSE
tara:strand:- start:8471 stop:8959 length:489 start_codon:yes stop_codon:yes gene_type:complete